MAFLGYSNNQVRQCALILRNRADKHLAYRKLATDIEKTGAVSFVFITEVWKAPSNDAHLTKEGMESTGLKESLDVIAADKTGKIYWCSAEFEKNADGQLIIGNEVCKYTELSTFNWLIPIFKAWKIVDPHIYKEIAKRAEPSSAKLCLCGSGQTFEKCCSGKYSQGINGLEKAHEFYRLHNFSKALNICRLSITQYLIWHKQHTVPIQTYAHSAVLKIMYVDIMSMFEHIEFLMFCYEKNGIHDDFPNVLHFMADKIDDVRWKNLLVFQEACWELFPNWTPEGEEKARRILLRIKDMDAVYDPRILQLYLQLFRDLMQFPKAIALIGKIVQYSVPIEEKLQYGAMMGIEYLQILDNASAIKELKNAILGFKKAAPKELTFEQTYRIGSTIALLGKLTEDTSAIEEAIICLEKGLGLIDLNAFEKAALLCAIAEAYESQHDWTKAVEYFNKSHKEVNNDLMVVFSAKALIRMGELEKVRKLLECVNFDSLDENGRFDFGIAWSDFAIQTSEHSDIEKALALLELHKPKTPYFKKVKEDLIAELKRSKDTNI